MTSPYLTRQPRTFDQVLIDQAKRHAQNNPRVAELFGIINFYIRRTRKGTATFVGIGDVHETAAAAAEEIDGDHDYAGSVLLKDGTATMLDLSWAAELIGREIRQDVADEERHRRGLNEFAYR